jgi:hypothetical protein
MKRSPSVAGIHTENMDASNLKDAKIVVPSPKDVITRGYGTVDESNMPFVNREEELWRLFLINAQNCSLLQRLARAPTSNELRKCNLLFCIQYYGGGKTTLGLEFGTQLLKGVLDSRACGKLFEEVKAEWDVVRNKGVRHVYCDVAEEVDIVAETLRVLFDVDDVDYTSVKDAAIQVVAHALTEGKPLLIHFDEVGADHNVSTLRTFASAIWKRMWRTKNRGHEMPIIFFLVTGRRFEYFKNIGLSISSPIGTELLVLNMLETKHVTEIRCHLMSCAKPLVLNGLNDNVAPTLDTLLCKVTGGAPRLLLYTLRALHYLCNYKGVSLDNDANINKAVNEDAYELLHGISAVLYELVPDDETRSSEAALLLALSLYETPLKYVTEVQVPRGACITVGRLLAPHAFFLAHRDNLGDEEFVVTLPQYHLKALSVKLKEGIPMLLSGMAGAAVALGEPWRIFELLPAHSVAIRARLSKPAADSTWASVIPQWFDNSAIAKTTRFNLCENPFSIEVIDMEVTLKDVRLIDARCEKGVFCVGHDKAHSCDGAYFSHQALGEWIPTIAFA